MSIPNSLLERLRKAEHVVIFTGAGVSQESGIPTFRDDRTGLWANNNPAELATPSAFARQRDVVWGWYEYRRRMVLQCEPNPAHCAIAEFANLFPKVTLITQNVDDLHERAGSQDVVHLHGSLHRPRCRGCGRPYEFPPGIPEDPSGQWRFFPPQCERCGGWIRPGVVWFGEDLPRDAWIRAESAAGSCDVFLCIGSTLVVEPAASLPSVAVRRGACVIQVNPNLTELNRKADYNLHGKAGEVMTKLLRALLDS